MESLVNEPEVMEEAKLIESGGLTCNVNAFEWDELPAAALIVNEYEPAFVAEPTMAPVEELSDIPAGSEPLSTDHVRPEALLSAVRRKFL